MKSVIRLSASDSTKDGSVTAVQLPRRCLNISWSL